MAEPLPNRPDVAARSDEVRREAVPKSVWTDRFVQLCGVARFAHHSLDDGRVEVMPPPLAGVGVEVGSGRWKDPLPDPVLRRAG